jgi:hypothetical protein
MSMTIALAAKKAAKKSAKKAKKSAKEGEEASRQEGCGEAPGSEEDVTSDRIHRLSKARGLRRRQSILPKAKAGTFGLNGWHNLVD